MKILVLFLVVFIALADGDGDRRKTEIHELPRIVGGRRVGIDKAPYIATIIGKGFDRGITIIGTFCTGVILSDSSILTYGSCAVTCLSLIKAAKRNRNTESWCSLAVGTVDEQSKPLVNITDGVLSEGNTFGILYARIPRWDNVSTIAIADKLIEKKTRVLVTGYNKVRFGRRVFFRIFFYIHYFKFIFTFINNFRTVD